MVRGPIKSGQRSVAVAEWHPHPARVPPVFHRWRWRGGDVNITAALRGKGRREGSAAALQVVNSLSLVGWLAGWIPAKKQARSKEFEEATASAQHNS